VSGKPVVVKDGRFGPYVTDGEYNATLRKDGFGRGDHLERAAELLGREARQGPGPEVSLA
jgi:DNA topoisomerase-1